MTIRRFVRARRAPKIGSGATQLALAGLPKFCLMIVERDEGRLDAFVGRLSMVGSRARAHKLIDAGAVRVSGLVQKASHRLRANDRVSVRVPRPLFMQARAENLALAVVYEDSDIIVVNKARGMVVHPGAGNYSGTLVNALLFHCRDLSGIGGVLRPGIVHRIDKNTSGLLMVAKNDKAHLNLAAQLKAHTATRVYSLVAVGEPKSEAGRLSTLIGRHLVHRKRMAVVQRGGKTAVTNWRVVQRLAGYSLLEARLETGRTHQIRVHMAHLGHPLVGDDLYGGRAVGPCKSSLATLIVGQALHAGLLAFVHPRTGEPMEFTVPMPEDMASILELLRHRVGLQGG